MIDTICWRLPVGISAKAIDQAVKDGKIPPAPMAPYSHLNDTWVSTWRHQEFGRQGQVPPEIQDWQHDVLDWWKNETPESATGKVLKFLGSLIARS